MFLPVKNYLIFKLVFCRSDQPNFIAIRMAMYLSIGRRRFIQILNKMYSDMQRSPL